MAYVLNVLLWYIASIVTVLVFAWSALLDFTKTQESALYANH